MNKILLILLTVGSFVFAMDVEEIVKKVDTRDDGDNIISDMSMVLIDKGNKQRVRSMKTYTKDFGVDTYKTIYFLAPSDALQHDPKQKGLTRIGGPCEAVMTHCKTALTEDGTGRRRSRSPPGCAASARAECRPRSERPWPGP